MKSKAKKQGLWNLFLPESDLGAGLTNFEYAFFAEENIKVVKDNGIASLSPFAQFIKDLSIETPNTETLIFVKDHILAIEQILNKGKTGNMFGRSSFFIIIKI
mgnify:CR=1 FL=1